MPTEIYHISESNSKNFTWMRQSHVRLIIFEFQLMRESFSTMIKIQYICLISSLKFHEIDLIARIPINDYHCFWFNMTCLFIHDIQYEQLHRFNWNMYTHINIINIPSFFLALFFFKMNFHHFECHTSFLRTSILLCKN